MTPPEARLRLCLRDAPEVERALTHAIRGWQPIKAPHAPRLCKVETGPEGHAVRSPHLPEGLEGLGLAAATCAVIADLVQDYIDSHPDRLALHCAGVRLGARVGGRLIALTGPGRAGKSTLAARLTAEPEAEVFCDDVLPVADDGQAIALGIAPRLRLPLPPAASAAFRAHIARHATVRDDRYGYVCAPTVAAHGTRAPLTALVILDRRAAAPARLHAVEEDEALRFLLSQNMSDLGSPEAAMARLGALLAGVECLRLVYSDLEDAVALLRAAFAGAGGGVTIHPALPPEPAAPAPALGPLAPTCWARNPEVMMQTRGRSAFLWLVGTPRVWHLNALAHAVWAMLEIPGTACDLAVALQARFPDQPLDRVGGDVNALLRALAAQGMIGPHQAAGHIGQVPPARDSR